MFRFKLWIFLGFCFALSLTFSQAAETLEIQVDGVAVNGSVSRGERASISLFTSFSNGSIFFTLDGSEPSAASSRYTDPFTITSSKTIRAIAYSLDFSQSVQSGPVTVSIVPFVNLTVSSFGGAINVEPLPENNGKYLSNTVVRLVAVPADGWTFMDWQGHASGSVNPLDLTLNGDKTVQAYFGAPITILAPSHGGIHSYPNVSGRIFRHGESVTLTPVPDAGYHLVTWGGAASGAANPLIYKQLTPNPSISAFFQPLPTGKSAVSVYTDSEGGTVFVDRRMTYITDGIARPLPGTNAYTEAEVVLLVAVAKPGWTFAGWAGNATGRENPLRVSLDGTKNIRADFSPGASITVHTSGGSVTKEPDLDVYPIGTVVTLQAIAAPGYTFALFSLNGADTFENPLNIVLTNDTIVFAQFNGVQRHPVFRSELGLFGAADQTGNLYLLRNDFVVAIDTNGGEMWRRSMPWNGIDPAPYVYDVAVDSAGNIVATANGSISSISSTHHIVRMRANGNPESMRSLGSGPEEAEIAQLAIGADNLAYYEYYIEGLGGPSSGIGAHGFNASPGSGNTVGYNDGVRTVTERLSRPAIGINQNRYFTGQLLSNAVYSSSPSGELIWRREVEVGIQMPTVLGTSTVFAVGGAGRLWAFGLDGTLEWSFVVADRLQTPSIGVDGTIYTGALDSPRVYAINPDGSVRWVVTPGRGPYSSPAIGSDGTIYITDRDSLFALNPNGERLWEFRGAASHPVIVGDRVYVDSGGGSVAVLANSTGPAASPWPMHDADAGQTAAVQSVIPAPFISVLKSYLAVDGFHLVIQTDPGALIRIFASSNLTNWSQVHMATANSNRVTWTDPANTGGERFYRALRN